MGKGKSISEVWVCGKALGQGEVHGTDERIEKLSEVMQIVARGVFGDLGWDGERTCRATRNNTRASRGNREGQGYMHHFPTNDSNPKAHAFSPSPVWPNVQAKGWRQEGPAFKEDVLKALVRRQYLHKDLEQMKRAA